MLSTYRLRITRCRYCYLSVYIEQAGDDSSEQSKRLEEVISANTASESMRRRLLVLAIALAILAASAQVDSHALFTGAMLVSNVSGEKAMAICGFVIVLRLTSAVKTG